MAKNRCKLSSKVYKAKDHSEDRYRCKKCGRTAGRKKKLCKAAPL